MQMDFIELTNRCLCIFFVIGFSSFHPRSKSERPKSHHKSWIYKCVPFIPVSVLSVVVFSSFFFAFYAQNSLTSYYEAIDAIQSYSLILSEYITNLTVIGQSFLYRRNFIQLHQKFVDIVSYANTRIKCYIQFDSFHQKYLKLVYILSGIFILTVVVRHVVWSAVANVYVQDSLLTLQLFSIIVTLHAVFYIGLVIYLMDNINNCYQAKLQVSGCILTPSHHFLCSGYENDLISLKRLKHLHYKLWEITKFVNQTFGWSITTLIFRNWIEIAYSIYWMYIYMMTDQKLIFILRN